jgi:hypothetical protein
MKIFWIEYQYLVMAFTPNLNSSGLASILLPMREPDFRACKGNIGLDSWSKPALRANHEFWDAGPLQKNSVNFPWRTNGSCF